jgi:hypothetical protein
MRALNITARISELPASIWPILLDRLARRYERQDLTLS